MRTPGLAALVSAAVSSEAAAQETARYFHYGHMWGGLHGWFMGPVLLIALIALSVILIVRWFGGRSHQTSAQTHAPAGPTPMDIVRERFAKGEIDAKEYEAKRKILEG